MLSEIDHSINALVNYFAQTKSRLDNDEVLYKDHQAYQKALGDYWAEATKIKGLFEALKLEVEKARKETRIEKVQNDRLSNELSRVLEVSSLQQTELTFLRNEYYMKPTKTEVKLVPYRIEPRDAFDMPNRWQNVENHLFRQMHDPDYNPEEKFVEAYKSKLKTTLHLDINI